jgi:murein DD-endopeptidase MepM/ murein hydrolase activator NlpD
MDSKSIKILQECINELLGSKVLVIDGIFGEKTKLAMEKCDKTKLENLIKNKGNNKFFPVKCFEKPKSYKSLVGKFQANRENGNRWHAGVDIYNKVGTEVYAIEDGIIRRISEKFYKNVGAVEIRHKTYIGRYCEITPLKIFKVGDMVKAGQLIGHIAKIEGLNISMLHFEMYSNVDDKSPLTVIGNNKFNRRGDLLNPTDFIDSLPVKK